MERRIFLVALISQMLLVVQSHSEPLTVLASTTYDETPYAVTDILPGGVNTPFKGIPVPEFFGADSVDLIPNDFTLPAIDVPVEVSFELILLNERNFTPIQLGDLEFDFYFTLNPSKKSLGRMTVIQTSEDDGGPAPDGYFLRESDIELLAILIPRTTGRITVTEAVVHIESPVPIPFSFDPSPETLLIEGNVGDISANWHTDKEANQRNFFPMAGMLQVPLADRKQFDAIGAHAARGGSVKMLSNEKFSVNSIPIPEDGIPDFVDNRINDNSSKESGRPYLLYDSSSGTFSVEGNGSVELVAILLSSGSGIFSKHKTAVRLNGVLDRSSQFEIFKFAPNAEFTEIDFGPVAVSGLAKEFLLQDLSARALSADGIAINQLSIVVEE